MSYSEKLLLNFIKSSKRKGIFPLIPVMLKSGINPNVLDPELGYVSLLMIAITIGNSELTKLLIRYNADINYENKVLSRCMLDNFIEGFDLILDTPYLSKESIEFSFFSSLLDEQRIIFTEKLIDKYREICWNARTSDGKSAMEFAVKIQNVKALQLLEKNFIIYL